MNTQTGFHWSLPFPFDVVVSFSPQLTLTPITSLRRRRWRRPIDAAFLPNPTKIGTDLLFRGSICLTLWFSVQMFERIWRIGADVEFSQIITILLLLFSKSRGRICVCRMICMLFEDSEFLPSFKNRSFSDSTIFFSHFFPSLVSLLISWKLKFYDLFWLDTCLSLYMSDTSTVGWTRDPKHDEPCLSRWRFTGVPVICQIFVIFFKDL